MELRQLKELCGLFLIPTETIQCFSQNNLAPLVLDGIFDAIVTRAIRIASRDGFITEFINDVPPLIGGKLTTTPDLFFGAISILFVGGIATINNGTRFGHGGIVDREHEEVLFD
nr:hypothetical protein [Thalassospira tepidiphila]